MRPTREGRVTPQRAGLIYKGIGVDPGTETEDPDPPADRAPDGEAFVPFLPPPDPGPVQDLNLIYGTDSDGGGNRPVVDPTNANDGNSATLAYRASFYNGGGTKTWWVKADLGAAYDVDEIVIRGGFGNSGENDPPWEIAHSPDGSTWTTAVGSYVWNGATNPRTATLTLTATQTKRYWRVGQTITYTGLIYPVKVHSFEINGAAVGDPSNPIWIDAPLTIDGDGTTYDLASEDTLTSTAGAFWRGDLGDSYLIASLLAEVGFEDAGSVTVLVQAGDESDYSDQATVATVVLTATGSYTSDDVAAPSILTGVHRYWQLVLSTAAQGVYVYEVGLFDPPEFTGAHEDLTGREEVDQHPADAVSYDNTVSGLTADDVQEAIDEIAAGGLGGFETYDEGGNPLAQDHGTLGATESIDAANGNHHRGTLDQNCTITVAPFADGSIEVVVYQNGTGGWDITWSGVDFGGGDDQPDQTASAATVFSFLSDDGTVYGFKAGGGGVPNLDDLANVDTTGKADGDIIVWDSGSSLWIDAAPPSGSVPSGTDPGDLLVWDGDSWEVLAIGNDDEVLTADSGETLGTKWAAGAGSTYYEQPVITNYASQFQASSTTCAVTVSAPATTDKLIAIVYSVGRKSNSITQTNVTWTERYTGNGNSQFITVYTGVAAASAGTTATANFTGSNNQFVEVITVNSAAAAFTSASAANTGTAATTALAILGATLTVGNYYLILTSANSPTSSYSGCSHTYAVLSTTGGLGRGGMLRANATRTSYWSLSSSAVNYFAAIVNIA